jgi:hypothetical protein
MEFYFVCQTCTKHHGSHGSRFEFLDLVAAMEHIRVIGNHMVIIESRIDGLQGVACV